MKIVHVVYSLEMGGAEILVAQLCRLQRVNGHDVSVIAYSNLGALGETLVADGIPVLVLGEAIVDEYQYCETIGKAGKEPVLVARHMSTERFPGGIVAVANHASAISDRVTMMTCLGRVDSQEEFITHQTKPKVESRITSSEPWLTIRLIAFP